MKKLPLLISGGVVAAAVGAIAFLPGETTRSADHLDPPSRTSPMADDTPDRAADIADIYAWAENGNMNIALTFAGPAPKDQPATYDRDVLYRIFVSTDGDARNTENIIEVRFGEGGPNEFGVQASGIPAVGTISGPVETELVRNNVRVQAGLFDDPFFFDLQGFMETRDTGEIRFDSNRDFFADQNLTAVVMQVPLANFAATGDITVWAATSRFGGQL